MKWVFWITFEKRDWFTNFWKTRGANFMDIQIFKLKISIGLPWKKDVYNQLNKYPGYIDNANNENLKHKISFLCK